MTELEEKFFKVFGIERENWQYCNKGYCDRNPFKRFNDDEICRNCEHGIFYKVPEITDHILLELVCILNKNDFYGYYIISAKNVEKLKEIVLNYCIKVAKNIKDDVRKLFEEA